MKYLVLIVLAALTISCTQHQCFYDIRPAWSLSELLENQFVQITDTNQIAQLNTVLNSEFNNPDLEYYHHRIFKKNPCIVVRIEDYFTREFAIWDDNTFFELAHDGGDCPWSSVSYSTVSKDSLITYVIETEYFMDEVMDTTLNEYTIDTIRYAVPLNGRKLPAQKRALGQKFVEKNAK